MNYAKMIAILERALWLREFCRDSKFVCDAVNCEVSDYDIDRDEKDAITADISKMINDKFCVESYLRSIRSDQDADDFRTKMINTLIAKYTEKLAEQIAEAVKKNDGDYNQLIG
jgi:hypothetical protein